LNDKQEQELWNDFLFLPPLLILITSFLIYIIYSVSLLIFTLGIVGLIINKNNYIMIIICIELMLISIILNFLFFSSENLLPQLYIIYILAIAAIESAIGLSIIVTYYKLRGSISLKYLNTLRG
tara:strand:+ start:2164 stop:2535 length:372 start_codon:yes stop_codon:yes gene_type:complete